MAYTLGMKATILAICCMVACVSVFALQGMEYAFGDEHLVLNVMEDGFAGTDMTGADLMGADLQGMDLSYTNLTGANLIGANLRGAVLIGTDLSYANLTGADMDGVKMWHADL